MLFFEKDIAIDMGTSTTQFYVRGKGVALREPTLVAVDKISGKPLKVGEDARKMLGRTPANIVAIHPLASGVVSDYDMTSWMMKEFIARVTSFSLFKPRVVVTVPSSISGVEERATIDALIEAGARKVYLVESAVATAMGAGVDVTKPNGYLVVDIGGGTTEVAVVSLQGVVECESLKTAGGSFDDAIVKYIRRKHNILVGARTAEDLKCSIGCVHQRPEVEFQEVKGRCLMTGLPKSVTVSSADLMEALEEPVEQILEAIHMVLERTPPELVVDISENGIILSGGGSMLWGMDKLIENRIGIATTQVDDAVACAAYGLGKLLPNLNDIPDGMINLARRRQMKG